MRHHRYSAGLLVTLHPLSEYPTEKWNQRRGNVRTLATHSSVSCALDDVCTRFLKGTNLRNLLIILRHEELHHVFLRIGEDTANEMLDDFMPSTEHTCRILGCTNHQAQP